MGSHPKMVSLTHGGGGKDMWNLINELVVSKVPEGFKKALDGVGLDVLDDGVAIKVGNEYVVMTIDSYTVKPLFFPGGDLGSLAASGTINDLLMMGAKPIGIVDAVVVEDGFSTEILDNLIKSLISTAVSEGVAVLGGDFKVMPKGSLDGVIITTAGIGIAKRLIIDANIKAGDKLIVTGPIAEHGSTIIASQLGLLDRAKGLMSDVRSLTKYLLPVFDVYGDYIHAARDPTRGGLASTLNEWVIGKELTIVIERGKVPVRESVRKFLDMLGIEPLGVASEGVAVLAVDPRVVDEVLNMLHELGLRDSSIIGEVVKPFSKLVEGKVIARTEVGGLTFVEYSSSPVPRIC
ncbi:MAG: hydrogenase expression/formation protein HypE [Sulfolobales archaeon]|nr:hydrogenase expression/formation protein HypE [Sulfolobales archaeon]MDW7969047.1 hydrogenase expression/formation protein HypE [Sulfolobales archaeon]